MVFLLRYSLAQASRHIFKYFPFSSRTSRNSFLASRSWFLSSTASDPPTTWWTGWIQVLASEPCAQPPPAPSDFSLLQLPIQPCLFSANDFAFHCSEKRGWESGRPSDSPLKTYPYSTIFTSLPPGTKAPSHQRPLSPLRPYLLQLLWEPPIIMYLFSLYSFPC